MIYTLAGLLWAAVSILGPISNQLKALFVLTGGMRNGSRSPYDLIAGLHECAKPADARENESSTSLSAKGLTVTSHRLDRLVILLRRKAREGPANEATDLQENARVLEVQVRQGVAARERE